MLGPISDRSAAAQERILASATHVFAAYGFMGGSLNEIAKGAQMTRAGVLHHYESKQAILLALLTQRDADLRLLREEPDEHPALDELFGQIVQLLDQILKRRDLVELSHSITAEASQPDHPARAWVERRHTSLREGFARSVRKSQHAGTVAADVDPDIVAALVLGAIEGVEGQWLIAPGAVDAKKILDFAFNRLLMALTPNAPSV